MVDDVRRRLASPGRGVKIGRGSSLRRLRGRDTGGLLEPGAIVCSQLENPLLIRLRGNHEPNLFREGEYLHVSDAMTKCMRAVALSRRSGVRIVGERISDSQAIMYEIGRVAQAHITNKIRLNSPGELYGDWVCRCKDNPFTHRGTAESACAQPPCQRCGERPTKYGELVLRHDELKLIGSVDIALLIDRALYLSEVKSIKHDDWEVLERPNPNHLIQIVFYWWLARHLRLPLHPQASILYVNKGYVFKSPYKEFSVEPAEHIHRLDEYLGEVQRLNAADSNGPLPPKICGTIQSPMAKKCELCTLCFMQSQ